MSLPLILITGKVPNEILSPLSENFAIQSWESSGYDLMPRSVVFEYVKEAVAIINFGELNVDKELLEAGNKLDIVANASVGFDNLDLKLMSEYGVWGTNAPIPSDNSIGEYVIGAMITLLRNFIPAHEFVKSGKWNLFEPGRWDGDLLHEKVLGIIGMGDLGKSVYRLANALGMKVIWNTRSGESKNEISGYVSFETLLQEADIISIHIPYNTNTVLMFNEGVFKKMKPGVIFVNTSRGKIVNEDDLISQLEKGHLGGAILDVFDNEPDVSPRLRSMKNVLLTPHMAGGTKTRRVTQFKRAIENVAQVLSGSRPSNALNEPLIFG